MYRSSGCNGTPLPKPDGSTKFFLNSLLHKQIGIDKERSVNIGLKTKSKIFYK